VSDSSSCPYVSRGGLKLRRALDVFGIDPSGRVCADLGASTGGFTDCLLQAGASRVYSVDTAYGEFAWKLRHDPRVTLLERTNALHRVPPEEGVDLVVADVGWTPQRLVIPAALRWLRRAGTAGQIISLVKPHYEASKRDLSSGGVLSDDRAAEIAREVVRRIGEIPDVRVAGFIPSPIRGGQHKGKGTGNAEYLLWITVERG